MLPLTPTHFCKKYTMISIFKATSFRDLSVFCMLKSIPSPFYDFCWASLSFLPFSPQGRSFSPLPGKFSWVAVIRFSAFSATFPKRFWRSSLLWRRHGLWTARDPPNACGGAVRDDFFFRPKSRTLLWFSVCAWLWQQTDVLLLRTFTEKKPAIWKSYWHIELSAE